MGDVVKASLTKAFLRRNVKEIVTGNGVNAEEADKTVDAFMAIMDESARYVYEREERRRQRQIEERRSKIGLIND